MKLIREELTEISGSLHLNESTGVKQWFIEGVFAEQEQKNRNGRVYPAKIMEREMSKYQSLIENRQAYGEVDHPERPQVLAKEASIRVVELYKKGNDWHGKALVLEGTTGGDHIIALLKNDCKIGVSTRGTGSVKLVENVNVVQEDYSLACWDVVLNPSANKAYVNGILEGKDFEMVNGNLVESCSTFSNHEKEVLSEDKLETLLNQFKNLSL